MCSSAPSGTWLPSEERSERGDRSEIGSSGDMNIERMMMEEGDKLILSGLTFYGYHGVKAEERALGQRFVVDVEAWCDLRQPGISDRVSDTIDYTHIYSIVKDVVEGPAHNLLESIAHHIASNTLADFPPVSAVRVKVMKPHVPVHAHLDYLGIQIFRTRNTLT